MRRARSLSSAMAMPNNKVFANSQAWVRAGCPNTVPVAPPAPSLSFKDVVASFVPSVPADALSGGTMSLLFTVAGVAMTARLALFDPLAEHGLAVVEGRIEVKAEEEVDFEPKFFEKRVRIDF